MKVNRFLMVTLMTGLQGCSNVGVGQESASDQMAGVSLEAAQDALEAAHVAFVKKDYQRMGAELKKALFSSSSQDSEVRDNAVSLLNETYAENCDYQFPVDWHVPSGVYSVTVEPNRIMEPDGLFFQLKIQGNLRVKDSLTQLKLTQYPDKVILDKASGIGDWEQEVNPEDPSDIYFELGQHWERSPVEPGMYLIEFGMSDGTTTKGWFILSDQFASSTPTLHVPAVGEHFANGTPSFRWDMFKSNEYKACEKRQQRIYVARIPSTTWDLKWSFREKGPHSTAATVGLDGEGVSNLDAGQYWFSLFFRESRMFGDLEIRRRATTSRNFYID